MTFIAGGLEDVDAGEDGVATQALTFNKIRATAARLGGDGMPKQAQNV
jgi:hypothetical protein